MSAWKLQYLTRGFCPAWALAQSCPKPTHFAQLDLIVVIDVVVWIIISSTATLTLCIYPDSRWLSSFLHYLVVFTNYLHSGCARKRTIPVIFSSYRLVPGQRASIETVHTFLGTGYPQGDKMSRYHVTASSQTAKSVDIGILDLNMFRKFLKNSNSMFDVALSMWLLFSLFQQNWLVLRQQRARSKKNIRPATRTDARDWKNLWN